MKLLFCPNHCVKYAKMRAFSDPYFSIFGKNHIRISLYKDRIINCNQSIVTETSLLKSFASQLTGFYIRVFTASISEQTMIIFLHRMLLFLLTHSDY